MNEKPNYYAIIPAEVRYDNTLRPNEKLLYGEITALAQKTGECWASNKYFCDLYNVKTNAIAVWIRHLKEKGYINIEYKYKGKEIQQRIIKIGTIQKDTTYYSKEYEGIHKKILPTIQKDKENNKNINNTSINIKEKIYKREKFKKPTIDEVQNYINEKNLNVIAEAFIDYYESNGWKVGKNQMKDWKATIRGWARREIKAAEITPSWYGRELEEVSASDEEMKELEERLKRI